MKRKIFLISVLFLVVFSFTIGMDFGWAKYPEKKIRFIVVFEPGAIGDLTARGLTRYANPYLGGRIYVENITGATGAIGWRESAKAAPDGYTITAIQVSMLVGTHTIKDFPSYDLFDPICVVNRESRMLFTKWDGRFKTVADLITFAKSNPGEVTVAVSGAKGINHLGIAAFSEATGAKFTVVPYPGAAPSMVAAMGGHVHIAVSGCAGSTTYVEGKKLRPLVVMGKKRYDVYPDVPTAKELGYDVDIAGFTGVLVPKGTPEEVKNVLVEAFRKATEDEGFKKLNYEMGQEHLFFGPKEADSWIKSQSDFYKNLATKLGFKPE